jgi:8-oxo-dGTP diphosphatase
VALQPEEISEHRLEPLPVALTMLRGPIRRRVKAACRAKGLIYLEDGRKVRAVSS